MTTPTPDRYLPRRTSAVDVRVVRDVVAVVLLVLGPAALIYAGFLVGDAAGWAVVGVLATVVGAALGYDRTPPR